MTSNEIREKYLKFFEDRGHVRIPPSPLVLKDDPTTLFTSSGMQQLAPYLKGEKPHPSGKRLVDSQPSFRAVDIDLVGDNRHTTFFEMLGNWSLGAEVNFKKEQLAWCWEFFTKELGLPKDKLWVSVFEGTADVPKDAESIEIWKSLGVPEDRIREYGVDKNWWSRTGTPQEMPPGEIGGPDSEVFYDFGAAHDPKYGSECHPNCECGRFLEIGNSVFMQYKKNEDGSLSELPQKNVDFGAGLERLVAASNNNPDIFQIDIFNSLKEKVTENIKFKLTHVREERVRVFLDHSRAAVFLLAEGLIPGKDDRESVLRKLVRRADDQLTILGLDNEAHWKEAVGYFKEKYRGVYSDSWGGETILKVILDEVRAYSGVLSKNLKIAENLQSPENINSVSPRNPVAGSAVAAFTSLATYGVLPEYSLKYAESAGTVSSAEDEKKWWEEFNKAMQQHRGISSLGAEEKFKVPSDK